MKFSLSTDQVDLQQTLQAYFASRAPLAEAMAAATDPDWSAAQGWSAMTNELGVQSVDVPDSLGGVGFGPVELSLVLQQAGRELYAGPLLASTGLASSIVLAAAPGSEAAATLLSRVVAGDVLVAAVSDDGGSWAAPIVAAAARRDGVGWLLSGTKRGVLQAHLADVLLVVAREADGTLGLFEVAPADATCTIQPSIDPARAVCALDLRDAPARRVASDVAEVLVSASLRANLAVASESLGAAGRVLEAAAEHASTRQQFGRPVGSFQGVKHKLASVRVDLELATSAVFLAACHLDGGDLAAARASIPMARLSADGVLGDAAAASVQVHGGIGFTWENVSHLFVKRARANRELLGGPAGRWDDIWRHGDALLHVG